MKVNRRYLCGRCGDVYGRDYDGKNFRFSASKPPKKQPVAETKGLRTCGLCSKK